MPDRTEVHDAELQRLKASIKQFETDYSPGILLTEVLDPGDEREKLPQFDIAKAKELGGLARRGVYKIVLKEDIPDNGNVLGSRFVLSIKNTETDQEIYKARYVVQGHKDKEKNTWFITLAI